MSLRQMSNLNTTLHWNLRDLNIEKPQLTQVKSRIKAIISQRRPGTLEYVSIRSSIQIIKWFLAPENCSRVQSHQTSSHLEERLVILGSFIGHVSWADVSSRHSLEGCNERHDRTNTILNCTCSTTVISSTSFHWTRTEISKTCLRQALLQDDPFSCQCVFIVYLWRGNVLYFLHRIIRTPLDSDRVVYVLLLYHIH